MGYPQPSPPVPPPAPPIKPISVEVSTLGRIDTGAGPGPIRLGLISDGTRAGTYVVDTVTGRRVADVISRRHETDLGYDQGGTFLEIKVLVHD
jgi:hypothetical protein